MLLVSSPNQIFPVHILLNIVADRIKMEGTPSFDPCPFLDSDSKELYQNPFSDNIDLDNARLNAPRVRVHASTFEKLQLLKLFLDALGFATMLT